MKKYLLFLGILIASLQAYGTHLMGGDITVYPDSANPTQYHFRVVHYRDTAGIPANSNLLYYLRPWDVQNNTWSANAIQSMLDMDPLQSGQSLPNFPYGVEVYTYVMPSGTPVPLAPGRWRLEVTECCRNGAILNMAAPLSESMTLTAEFEVPPSGSNTTPEFLAMPIVYLPVNQPWYYNPLPYDADNDSISWAMTTPINIVDQNLMSMVPVVGYTTPAAAAAGPYTLNPVTGEVTWEPNTLGHFVTSFTITEYKNGVPVGNINRDMQAVVINGITPPPSFVTVSQVLHHATGNYNYILYTPGQQMQFKIRGTDGTLNDLTMQCISGLFKTATPPTFSYAPTGSGNTIEGTFSWTAPASQQRDELLVFRLGNGVFSTDYTLLLRKNPVTGVGSVSSPVSGLTAFPNPAAHRLTVSLQTAAASDLRLELVDVTGRVSQELFSGALPKGTWQQQFDLQCGNGVYFLRAVSGGKVVATERLSIVQ